MYKLVIVEDEKDVRHRILSLIERAESNFEVVGEYETGIDAYDGILTENPDLILTDIKIPYINGIELVRRLRQALPLVKAIIITGYNEFDYAKEAANLGVVGFVSKPVTLEDISEHLKKAEAALDDEYFTATSLERFQSFYENSLPIIKENDLNGLSNMSVVPPAFKNILHHHGINLDYPYFVTCLFDFDEAQEHGVEKYDLAVAAVREQVHEHLDSVYDIELFGRYEKLCLILKSHTPPNIKEIEQILELIIQRVGRYSDMPLSVGISSAHENSMNFAAMVKEAKHALEYRRVIGGSKVFVFDNVTGDNLAGSLLKITSYIEAHFCDENLSFLTLSEGVNFSMSYISALLKKNLNTSFVKLLTSMRMEKAKELLADPNLKIIDVAERLGYSDSYYFSHCFKKYFGLSPKEFRTNEAAK